MPQQIRRTGAPVNAEPRCPGRYIAVLREAWKELGSHLHHSHLARTLRIAGSFPHWLNNFR